MAIWGPGGREDGRKRTGNAVIAHSLTQARKNATK